MRDGLAALKAFEILYLTVGLRYQLSTAALLVGGMVKIALQLGDQTFQVGPGDVAVVPPGVPHAFTNNGPGRSKLVCIHASPIFIGEWLK